MRILHELNKAAANVTRLSKSLDLTTQETSRHVSRLKETGLVTKDHEGHCHLTSYADLVLKQIEGLDFLSQHKDYFETHSLARVPEKFILRIGDLADSKHMLDMRDAFYAIERMIREAGSYIWNITDQHPLNIFSLCTEAQERGVKNKALETKDFTYSSDVIRDEVKDYDRILSQRDWNSRTKGLLEERYDDRVDVYLFVSEKEAAVAFPLNNGSFDYLVFTGKNERFLGWCSDLFNYYWEKAQTEEAVTEKPCMQITENPRVLKALERIVVEPEARLSTGLALELEKLHMTSNGKLTRMGWVVYDRLRRQPRTKD
jgi:predicted transcriptional regulator